MPDITMDIVVWTPEDRATRDAMVEWCQKRMINVTQTQLSERKFQFGFSKTPFTSQSNWSLFHSALSFYHEMHKHVSK